MAKLDFYWKDYRDDNQQKVMRLDAHEFIRRFLLHVLPKGMPRIRYYGILATRNHKQRLAHLFEQFHQAPHRLARTKPGSNGFINSAE